MNDPLDPHTLVPLQKVLDENSLGALDYFRAYLEDRAPAVIVFDGGLYLVQSDLHSWKRKLRAASFHRKAVALGVGASVAERSRKAVADRRIDRKTAAVLVTTEYFPATKRALEKWAIPGVLLNGRVYLREADVRAYAQAILDRAPAAPAPRLRRNR